MIATLTDQRHLPGLSRRPGTLPDHISPSAAKSYLGCSLQFYFERVARIRKNTSVALHLGKAVHAALQVFHLARWRGGNDSPEAIDAAYGKAYLTKNAQALELVPLSASSGISMVVVPVGDPARPSKVFVIEVAQSIRLEGGATSKAGGVLVYSVDATLASGQNSVVVYPRAGIDEAPYQAGDAFNHADAPSGCRCSKASSATATAWTSSSRTERQVRRWKLKKPNSSLAAGVRRVQPSRRMPAPPIEVGTAH